MNGAATTSDISFDTFAFWAIRFQNKILKSCNERQFVQERITDHSNGSSLAGKYKLLSFGIKAANAVKKYVLPQSEIVDRIRVHLTLRQTDCVIGIRQSEVSPLAMARKVPKRLWREEFARYAEKLSLPHTAKIIRAGAKTLQQPVEVLTLQSAILPRNSAPDYQRSGTSHPPAQRI